MFSVIVPVYNINISYLKKCFDSVINQDCTDFELIIVDDGSIDEIAQFCDYYAYDHKRVRVIHQLNKGLAAARNTGIRHAIGEWIIHLDADDWIRIDLLSSLNKIQDKNNADVILFGYCSVNNGLYTKYDLVDINAFSSEYSNIKIEILKSVLRYSNRYKYLALNTTWGKAFKKTFLDRYNLKFNEELKRAQDVIYNLYAFNYASAVQYLPGSYYFYRNDTESLSRTYNKYTYERMTKTAKACVEFMKDQEFRNDLEDASMSFVRGCFINIIDLDILNVYNKDSYCLKKERFLKILNTYPYNIAFGTSIKSNKISLYIEENIIALKNLRLLIIFRFIYNILHKIFS